MTCAHVDADKSNQGGPADHPQRRERIPCTCWEEPGTGPAPKTVEGVVVGLYWLKLE